MLLALLLWESTPPCSLTLCWSMWLALVRGTWGEHQRLIQGMLFQPGSLRPDLRGRQNRASALQDSMKALWPLSPRYSHDCVLVQGKRDFVDVIKSSNHLILRQGSYPDYLDSMSVSIAKTFLFWHRRRGNLRYWKQERNLLQGRFAIAEMQEAAEQRSESRLQEVNGPWYFAR